MQMSSESTFMVVFATVKGISELGALLLVNESYTLSLGALYAFTYALPSDINVYKLLTGYNWITLAVTIQLTSQTTRFHGRLLNR